MSKGGPRPAVAGWDEDEEAGAAVATAAAQQRPGGSASGGVFKSAAVQVLRRARRLMTTGEICRLALEWGLLSCSGKTPEATMASAMYGDIKHREHLSLFVRPQEGLFGLREWEEQGQPVSFAQSEPAQQLQQQQQQQLDASTEAARCTAGPAACGGGVWSAAEGADLGSRAPRSGSIVGGTSMDGSGRGPRLGARAAAPAKRSGSTKGPGRPKKARRSRASSDDDDEEWSPGSQDSGSELEADSDDEAQLRPRLYSLRRGEQGLAVAAAAATGPASLVGTSALAGFLTGRAHHPAAGAGLGAVPATLEPLDLPDLRPRSAGGSKSQLGVAGVPRGGSAGGLLSPPLYTVLQSPHAHQRTASSGGGAANLASLFSPSSSLPGFRSPLVALPAFGNTPAGLPGLLSPDQPGHAALGGSGAQKQQRPRSTDSSRQERVASALKGTAAAGATAPAAPGTALSAMVPVCEGAAAGLESFLPLPFPLPCADLAAFCGGGGPLPGALLPPPAGVPAIVFRPQPAAEPVLLRPASKAPAAAIHADCWLPLDSAAAAAGTFDIVPDPACDRGEAEAGGAGGASAAAAAAIVAKIAEVEGKVHQVEAKWGSLSLKTGRAYFLLHHACRHPAAAPLFRRKAEEALCRSQCILQHNSQVDMAGGGAREEEFLSLLHDVRAAVAAAVPPTGAAAAPGGHA